jgi:stage V sporulation protein SpoVS
MSIQTVVRSGRLYVRTELLVAEMRLRSYARKAALLAVALGVALFGLGMLNVAAFLWLSETYGPVRTALGIALVNFAVAALAFAVGYTLRPGAELQMAEQMRDTALETVESEAARMQSAGVTGLVTGAVEIGAARLLLPTVSALLGGLRKKTPAEAGEPPAAKGKR